LETYGNEKGASPIIIISSWLGDMSLVPLKPWSLRMYEV